jgi:chlorite dismutase
LAERLLNLFAGYRFTEDHRRLDANARQSTRNRIAQEVAALAPASHLYRLFPTRADADFLIWTAIDADDPATPAAFFTRYAKMAENWPGVQPVQSLWGLTRPSMYARGKSEQDMDPLEGPRAAYLVVYPFTKTKEWYLMSMDARQGQMNEHIKLGKQYPDIKQLLLYSFGLQDQEFVVAYETEDLARFSELVQALRSTEARRYTASDVPILTGIHQTSEAFVG